MSESQIRKKLRTHDDMIFVVFTGLSLLMLMQAFWVNNLERRLKAVEQRETTNGIPNDLSKSN